MKDLLTALIYDILKFLQEEKQFFEFNQKERKSSLEKLAIPEDLKTYLVETSAENFQNELTILVNLLEKGSTSFRVAKGEIFLAIAKFLTGELAQHMDDPNEKMAYAGKFAPAMKDFLHNTYEEITYEIEKMLELLVEDNLTIFVQTARQIPSELKADIRKNLLKKYPLSFPRFSVNKDLIGGFRLFINGNVTDCSWLESINVLTSLQYINHK